MATKGQSLENLVELLEKMDMAGAVIKTRDKIYDKVAQELREVDVSVRFAIGSHEFLIVFECRDRNRKNGPDWIEQIIQKTKDIGANKVIAVSSSGFTRSAIEKANHYGINLRTIEEITEEDVFNWFKIKKISGLRYIHDIQEIVIIPKNGTTEPDEQELKKFIEKHKAHFGKDQKFINQKGNFHLQSPNDLIFTLDRDTLFSGVICGGPVVPIGLEVYPHEGPDFQIVVEGDEISIDHFIFITLLQIVVQKSDIHSVKSYNFDGKSLAQIVEFEEYPFPEGKRTVELILKPGEKGNRLSIKIGEVKKEKS